MLVRPCLPATCNINDSRTRIPVATVYPNLLLLLAPRLDSQAIGPSTPSFAQAFHDLQKPPERLGPRASDSCGA